MPNARYALALALSFVDEDSGARDAYGIFRPVWSGVLAYGIQAILLPPFHSWS